MKFDRWLKGTAVMTAMVVTVMGCTTAASPTPQPTPPPTAAPTGAPPTGGAPTEAPSAAPEGPLALVKPLPRLDTPVTVKARLGTSLTTAPFWYAIEKGYFEQFGITLEQVEIQSSGDVVAPLVTNQIDIAGTSFGSGLYNAFLRDIQVRAVADNGQLDEGLAGSAAVVKAGTRASYGDDWCALKDKKVVVVSRTTGLFPTLIKALESCQLTENDVTIIELGFGETNAAILNGSVDVAFQVEPLVSRGVADGILDIWKPLDEAYKGQQMNVLLYAPAFAEKRDVAIRFLVAYLAGARDFRRDALSGDRTELGQILAKYLPVKDPAAYRNMILMGIDPDGEIDRASVRQVLQVFQATGSLPPGQLDLSFISDELRMIALSHLGPFQP